MNNSQADFVLYTDNLHDIPFQKYEKDFTFIVNGRAYKTNRLVADILSPKIKKMHFTDSTNTEYYINVKDDFKEANQEDYFQEFLNLAFFQKTNIDLNHQKRYLEYFYLLGNITEYVHLINNQSKKIMVDNAINRLISILSIESKMDDFTDIDVQNSKEIIKFVASHFEDIDKKQLSELNVEILDEILRSESLIINDEDSLVNFILSLYEKNISYSYLFEYVLFCNISQETLEKFVNTVQFDDINSPIWKSICERLLHPKQIQTRKSISSKVTNLKINKKRKKIDFSDQFIEFHCKENDEFNGIMNYLNNETGSNIHDNGTINITSNSISSQNFHPKLLVDYHNDAMYNSEDKNETWVIFDFKDFLIQLESYSIKSQKAERWNNCRNLRNWNLEVSNDKSIWILVDSHIDDSRLNGNDLVANFHINNDNNFYRYVRLRVTGKNWEKDDSSWSQKLAISLNMIEFFGKLKRS